MKTIVAISDLHGQLPPLGALPAGHILVIAGDVCPDFKPSIELRYQGERVDRQGFQQGRWLNTTFRGWLEGANDKYAAVIGIAGNHDFVFEKEPILESIEPLPWIYLEDYGVEVFGIKFWGTPWVPNLAYWAFCANDAGLRARAALIPNDIDVLVTHGPPYGVLDHVRGAGPVGDVSIAEAVERIQPKAVICGHIHEQHGQEGGVFNVSLLDDRYEMVYPPTVIEL